MSETHRTHRRVAFGSTLRKLDALKSVPYVRLAAAGVPAALLFAAAKIGVDKAHRHLTTRRMTVTSGSVATLADPGTRYGSTSGFAERTWETDKPGANNAVWHVSLCFPQENVDSLTSCARFTNFPSFLPQKPCHSAMRNGRCRKAITACVSTRWGQRAQRRMGMDGAIGQLRRNAFTSIQVCPEHMSVARPSIYAQGELSPRYSAIRDGRSPKTASSRSGRLPSGAVQ